MPTSAPPDVARDVTALNVALDASGIPAKSDDNLLIATWNLRGFGGISATWDSEPRTTPKRGWRAVALIAEIIRRFDVVAVQEVKRDTTALRFLVEQLGGSWRFITTDTSEGDAGNDERLTYLYDSTRVDPSGLVGEIVLPAVAGSPVDQFARAPYAASFARKDVEFILTTVHILWGDVPQDRIPELVAFADWMRGWADRANDWNGNLLVLGDFNVDRDDSPLARALFGTGLSGPPQLNAVPRTIFADDKNKNFYDQIAWFWEIGADDLHQYLRGMKFTDAAGYIDFVPHVFAGLSKTKLSWRISDHYPLWVEFRV
ncbi:endonuclease/exonuclease/phosphatase family protein [Homoserinibacter sp. GY 40078]|uniref:endonuclease/exonuclease/phosphatase family protein n=1 Tax=Homoserinibacter sp. GY 40078 TaxID=2603275 RepID=UPI0011C94641|nr:endonuclease/exonuclease/phosphatase family protein [Homoserinibacter sp. GY 40078]TXK16386.1 hypothetical protein FVQ89_14155 [Homoserinibacter sp. GY 40078]